MKSADKARLICDVLDRFYPDPQPPLHHQDAFTLLVAVVLSAQTTDKKVNEITPALFARASTPEEMAKLSPETIFQFIRQVSFAPTKSKNLRRMCELLVERHGGKVPHDMEALEQLPGVGHKSASVVISQWFHEPAFPVDTHIHRLATRWGLSSGKDVVTTENDLKKIFPPETWIRLHMQNDLLRPRTLPSAAP